MLGWESELKNYGAGVIAFSNTEQKTLRILRLKIAEI